MLNINSIQNFGKTNILSFTSKKSSRYRRFNYPGRTDNSNLKPLEQDTVTLSSRNNKSIHDLTKAFLNGIDNREECKSVSRNAKYIETKLNKILKSSLEEYQYDEINNPDGFIKEIVTRVKSPASIREKAANKLASKIIEDKKAYNLEDTEDIKGNLGDIIGARIVLRNSSQESSSKIIDSLIKLVIDKKLKITKIESYTNSELGDEYRYFSQDDLEKLKNVVNGIYGTNIEVDNNKKNTGYMALHLDVDFADPKLRRIEDGYSAEIQIVGDDVAKLKDVEDFCYKLKKDMEIKSGHPAYKTFEAYFKKYISDSGKLKEFETYTRKAYAKQRMKEPQKANAKINNDKYFFPTPQECGVSGLDKRLSFENLSKIKTACDVLYKLTEELI